MDALKYGEWAHKKTSYKISGDEEKRVENAPDTSDGQLSETYERNETWTAKIKGNV